MIPEGSGARVGADDLDDERPELLGQIVAHVLQQQQLRAGHELGGAQAPGGVDERVVAAVNHEGRGRELCEALAAVAGGDDAGELAGRALGVERAVEGLAGRDRDAVGVEVPLAPERLHGLH